MAAAGCQDARVLTSSVINITDAGIRNKLGNARFESRTLRAFKLPLEDRCEDYGQVAVYRGTLPNAPHAYQLDDHHLFETGRPMLVCSNTAMMLADTRLSAHFRVEGDLSTHFGLFPCGPTTASAPSTMMTSSGSCC